MEMLSLSRRIPLLGIFGPSSSDDDFADRLNYKYTVAILVIFAFVITSKHLGHNQVLQQQQQQTFNNKLNKTALVVDLSSYFFSTKINCWVPALFSKNFEEYTNLVCWITNTYYVPLDKSLPASESEKKTTELKYYQWVAYILLFLSLLFYLPRVIWRTLSTRSGIDLKDVIEASNEFKSINKLEKHRNMMEYMVGTLDHYVDHPRRQRDARSASMSSLRRVVALVCVVCGKFLGNYLVVLYLFVKLLYIVNCVAQMLLVSVLLGKNYYLYGTSIFRDLLLGRSYADSEYFPRVTMCKFNVRELGLKNFSHEYNVQCVLPINLFNQQIFTFLWFWYSLLLVINTSNLFVWLYRFTPHNQFAYATRRIQLMRVRMDERASALRTRHDSGSVDGDAFIQKQHERRVRHLAMSKVLDDHEAHKDINMARRVVDQRRQRERGRETPTTRRVEDEFYRLHFEVDGSYDEASSANDDISSFKLDGDDYMRRSSFTASNYRAFVHDYLESDGMFMIRMIGSNSGDYVCTQLLHNMWRLFLFKRHFVAQEANQNIYRTLIEEEIAVAAAATATAATTAAAASVDQTPTKHKNRTTKSTRDLLRRNSMQLASFNRANNGIKQQQQQQQQGTSVQI